MGITRKLFPKALLLLAAATHAQTPEVRATLCLRSETAAGHVRYGTGVQLLPGFLLTAGHVLEAERAPEVLTSDRLRSQSRVVVWDRQLDLALLEIARRPGEVLLQDGWPVVGQQVLTVGCQKERLQIRAGRVLRPKALIGGRPFIELKLPIDPGYSGAPLFDREGHLLGIIRGYAPAQKEVAYAIPVSEIVPFLLRTGFPAYEILMPLTYGALYSKALSGERALEKQLLWRAVSQNPDYRPFWLLAVLYAHQGRPRKALAQLLHAAERAPDRSEIFQELCRVYRLLTLSEAAQRSCRYAGELERSRTDRPDPGLPSEHRPLPD